MEIMDNLDLISNNFLQVNVLFDEEWPTMMTDQPAMTSEILASNLGGVLSLWLGVTIMAVFEFLELIYRLVLNNYSERKKKQIPVANFSNTE
jgi:hypothetical protein